MTPETEKLHKLTIQNARSSTTAKREAIEFMWEEKIKGMMIPDCLTILRYLTAREVLEYKEEKCNLYFDNAMSSSFGFKDYPAVGEKIVDPIDARMFLEG